MNVELLLKVKEKILAEPSQFVMSAWFTDQSRLDIIRTNDLHRTIANCGTAACIAGWIVTLSRGETPSIAYKVASESFSSVRSHAAVLLGVSKEETDSLFGLQYWPQEFWVKWKAAKTIKQRAKVAADRIDNFILTYSDNLKLYDT